MQVRAEHQACLECYAERSRTCQNEKGKSVIIRYYTRIISSFTPTYYRNSPTKIQLFFQTPIPFLQNSINIIENMVHTPLRTIYIIPIAILHSCHHPRFHLSRSPHLPTVCPTHPSLPLFSLKIVKYRNFPKKYHIKTHCYKKKPYLCNQLRESSSLPPVYSQRNLLKVSEMITHRI